MRLSQPSIKLLGVGAFGLTAAFLPLALKTGQNLEYEYAVLTSYLFLLLPVLVLALAPRKADSFLSLFSPDNTTSTWKFSALGVLIGSSLLPYLLLYSFGICLCSWRESLFWWLIQTIPSLPLSLTLCFACFELRRRNKYNLLTSMLLLAATFLVLSLLNGLWFSPQKRLVHPLLGFIHGPIYDSWIPVDSGVVLLRGAHFFVGLSLFSFLAVKRWLVFTIGIPISLALALWAGTYPSTENGLSYLTKRFPGQTEGKGFILYFQPDRTAKMPPNILRVYRETAFHLQELTQLTGISPHKPIHVFVYPNRNTKKLWFGGGTTDITDVVTPSIHITAEYWPHPTLRHELVHAITSSFGFYGLGFHPNMAFTEGLAIALAPEDDAISLDDGSASLLTSGRIKDLSALFSPLFWKESGARSYTVAGSFIRYLTKIYGLPSVLKAYAGSSWPEATGKSLDDLVAAWRTQVTQNFNIETFRLTTEALYRHPGVLQDLCPHSVSMLRQPKEPNDLWLNLRRGKNWDPHKDLNDWHARFKPSNRYERSTSVVGFNFQTLEDLEQSISAADLALAEDNAQESLRILEHIQKFIDQRRIAPSLARQVFVRNFFLKKSVAYPLYARDYLAWYRYVAGNSQIPKMPHQLSNDPTAWLQIYLHLRKHTSAVVQHFTSTNLLQQPIPASIPANFAFEYFRILATFAETQGDFNFAASAYKKVLSFALSGQAEFFQQEVRKNLWLAAEHLSIK